MIDSISQGIGTLICEQIKFCSLKGYNLLCKIFAEEYF